MLVVESAHGVEGGALAQRTWHTWCPHLINRYNTTSLRLRFAWGAACEWEETLVLVAWVLARVSEA
jgi:hypothetical protein